MGVHENIGADVYPEQSRYKGERAFVVFHYDTSRKFEATVLRDDKDAPWETLLQLDDGRVVRSVECQWSPWLQRPE